MGNIEAREAVEGAVDVIVADGYSGNIFLKTMEGTGLFLAKEIKGIFMKNLMTKLAAAPFRRAEEVQEADELQRGGRTALLGISKPVIKAHGSSDALCHQKRHPPGQSICLPGIIGNISDNIGPDAAGRPGGRIIIFRVNTQKFPIPH